MGVLGKIAKIDELSSEMVVLYSEMIKSIKNDKSRFDRLEVKVNALWPKLSREQQLLVCDKLIEMDVMSQKVKDCLISLNGSITTNIPPNPCYKIKG